MNQRPFFLSSLMAMGVLCLLPGLARAAGKFSAPIQNSVTISFENSTPGMTNFLDVDPTANYDAFWGWDDSHPGARASWGVGGGGRVTEINAGIEAGTGPSGGKVAKLEIPTNDGLGGYYANLLWQVKGLRLGNTYGGSIVDTASGTIPVPTNFDSIGSYLGITVAANFLTDVPNATFRVNLDTGTTEQTKTVDDGVGGTYAWVRGNVPGLVEQSRAGSRVYLVDPGDLATNTWSSTDGTLVSELSDLDGFSWSNPTFQPFYGKGVRSFNLTKVGITFPGGWSVGQLGKLLVDGITLSGPDVLKYNAADFNTDEMVDDTDIDMLFDAVLGLALNETLLEPDPGFIGAYAWEPVWGVDKILNAKEALTEKFSLTASDTPQGDVLDSADIDYLIENILGTQYGDLDLDGDKDATDLATITSNQGMSGGAGWADGDLDGDDDVDADDLAIFGSIGIPGDFDGNGTVDGLDFLLWQRNTSIGDLADWEANFGTPLLVAAAGAVPEPASVVLLLTCVGWGFGRARKQR